MFKKNKVKFGLRNVHVAPVTEDGASPLVFGDYEPVPGAVNLVLNAEGEQTRFYADDGLYWDRFTNNGYTGTLEIALLPDFFREKYLAEVEDDNGVMIEDSEAKFKPFAMAFEFDGDASKTRHVVWYNKVSRPSVEGSTVTNTSEPKTDTLTITALPRPDTRKVKGKTGTNTTQVAYDNWYEEVYEPGIVAAPVEPSEG